MDSSPSTSAVTPPFPASDVHGLGASGDRALLVDLDNIGLPSTGTATAVLEALLAAVGHYDVAIAAGRDCSYAAYGPACRALGVPVIEAPAVPNGADERLVAAAATLASDGVADFVVISGDHAFADLPGTVRVVMPVERKVSTRLAETASEVVRVTLPRGRTRSRASASRARRRATARRAAAVVS